MMSEQGINHLTDCPFLALFAQREATNVGYGE